MDSFSYSAQRIEYKGKAIQTYSFGEGDKVIFSFPSFPHSGLYYLFFTKFYPKNNYRFITFDLPGWAGWSDNIFDKEPFSMELLVDIAQEVLDHYKVKDFSLIGYSFGGALALRLAAVQYNRLNKLVLVSPVAFGSVANKNRTVQLVKLAYKYKMTKTMRVVLDWMFYHAIPGLKDLIEPRLLNMYIAMYKEADKNVILESAYKLFTTDHHLELQKIVGKLPIMVINSVDEKPLFRRQAEYIRRFLSNEMSYKLRGTHDDFILRPTSHAVSKVMDFLTR